MSKSEFVVLGLAPRDAEFDKLVSEYEALMLENENTNWSCITNKTATPSQKRAWDLKEFFNFVDPERVREPVSDLDDDEAPVYTCPKNMFEHTVPHKHLSDATNNEDSPAILLDIEKILLAHPNVKKILVRLDT
jgi:hypothetical protein